jgi:hypothetical protein
MYMYVYVCICMYMYVYVCICMYMNSSYTIYTLGVCMVNNNVLNPLLLK